MNNKSVASRLIALAIKDRLDTNVQFGLLAQGLPPFDTFELYLSLKPQPEKLRLAFIGFDDIDDRFPPQIARDVETAISWRNDPNVSSQLVVILNPTRPLDKIHSLTLLEPFTDQNLRRAICRLAEKEARLGGDYLKAEVWRSLFEIDKSDRDKLPFVAVQVVDFYNSLLDQSVSLSLPFLGLLPDPELSAVDDVKKKLQDNYAMVDWLSDLDSQTFEALARASSGKNKEFQRTFSNIWAYSKSPTNETLKSLSVQAVRQLKDSPKSPQPKTSVRKPLVSGDIQLVDQLLKLAQEKDTKVHQEGVKHLEEQARRVSQMYFQGNLAEDCINDPKDSSSDRSEEVEFELLSDWKTGEDVGRADKFKDEASHPLSESFQSWLRPLCWGGEVEANLSSQDIPDITQLFSGKIPLAFRPLRPFESNDPKSLVHLFRDLDEVSGMSVSKDNLVNSIQALDEHRRFLLQYHELFLYYPQYAVQDRDVHLHLQAYLDSYRQLCHQVTQVCRRLQEHYPNAVEQAIAQLLALDTIFVRINQPEQNPKILILLTSLHPLHLWKWVELSEYLSNISRPLTTKESERVRQATKQLPTILNTFLIHPAMYNSLPGQTETRLVFAGEINNPDNESTIGIPYYQSIAEQVAGADGIQQFAAFVRQFLILYPPAQLGLSLVLIDPPQLAPLLKELVDFSRHSEREVHLEGAKVFIFWTEASSYDEWQGRDEDTLQLFRDDPRWMLYIDLDVRTLKQIHEELSERNVQPHITLLCDPSDAVARSTFRTVQDDATPFGVPIQVIYDQIVDKPQVIPAATGGLFDAQSDLRHILSGDLNRTILGVGSRGVQLEDLERFLDMEPYTHWLAIIDRPQGTLELPASLGRRLLRLATGSRYLIIHTTEKDWQNYWQKQIKYKLNDWRLSADATMILNGLLELVPLFSNGMLDLIQNSPTNYANVLNEIKVAEMLGVMAILNWYRQDFPGLILIPIGGQDFDDWYGEIEFKESRPPYYLGLWVEKNRLKVDIISIHTTNPTSPTSTVGDEFDHLSLFAQALEPLFEDAEAHFILTPIRRAKLRERLIASVFAPSESGDELLLTQSKQAKAQWAKVINELFGSSFKPGIRLLRINVDFETKNTSVKVNRIHDLKVDRYDCYQVSLPGILLAPTTRITTTILTPATEPSADNLTEGELISDIGISKASVPPTELVEFVSAQASRLRRVLEAYGLAIAEVDVSKSQIGPRFIRYWLQLLPPAGRLSEVQKYAEDIAREMGSRTVPFIDNIPGERYVGIDLARDEPVSIPLLPALEKLSKSQPDQLLFAAGQNPAGDDLQFDLVKLPHMLVAGQTGSGKTVFLSSLITSLAWRHGVDDLQLMIVDPKQMDFGIFETLPHLQDHRIFYEPADAIEALRYLLNVERPRRTELIRQANCPNNLEYNRRFPDKRLPWRVVVIDEFADLILSLNKRERDDFEKQVNRLAATGRAAGIHLVIATQRPTTDVITGTIKANITARVSFRLPSQVDSRTILDRTGAENLLGQGDMLVSINNDVQRLQGYYASYSEFQDVVNSLVGGL